jgi:transposase
LAAGLAEQVQEVTGGGVMVAFVDQGYTGPATEADVAAEGVEVIVVKHHEATKGFVVLPRRWVVERTFGWLGRFRRLARDYERPPETLAAWHWVAFIALMLARLGLQSA